MAEELGRLYGEGRINVRRLAAHLNRSSQVVHNWIIGRNDPRDPEIWEQLFAGLDAPGVLRRAKGSQMTPNTTTGFAPGPGGRGPSPLGYRAPVPGAGRTNFPLLGVAGAAAFPVGSGEWDGESFVSFPDDLYDEGQPSTLNRFAIQVRENSQDPLIKNDDFVLVHPDSDLRMRVFTLIYDTESDGNLVKIPSIDKDGRLVLKSHNKECPPRPMTPNLHVVGYLVAMNGTRRTRRGGLRTVEFTEKDGLNEDSFLIE
jgi:SOS-response transcriptional repressor LexA